MKLRTVIVSVLTLVAWVSTAAAFSPTADHYLCRQVKDLKNPKFVKVLGVSVTDPVGSDTCDMKKLYMVCQPTDKNGSGVNDPTTSLCCYKAKCTSKPAVTFTISDQFGNLDLETKKPKFLCNPCDVF